MNTCLRCFALFWATVAKYQIQQMLPYTLQVPKRKMNYAITQVAAKAASMGEDDGTCHGSALGPKPSYHRSRTKSYESFSWWWFK